MLDRGAAKQEHHRESTLPGLLVGEQSYYFKSGRDAFSPSWKVSLIPTECKKMAAQQSISTSSADSSKLLVHHHAYCLDVLSETRSQWYPQRGQKVSWIPADKDRSSSYTKKVTSEGNHYNKQCFVFIPENCDGFEDQRCCARRHCDRRLYISLQPRCSLHRGVSLKPNISECYGTILLRSIATRPFSEAQPVFGSN